MSITDTEPIETTFSILSPQTVCMLWMKDVTYIGSAAPLSFHFFTTLHCFDEYLHEENIYFLLGFPLLKLFGGLGEEKPKSFPFLCVFTRS